jgi:hypothetical protein
VEFQGVPLHASELSTAQNFLRGFCSSVELHPDTAACRDLFSFTVLAWCRRPELIPVSMALLIPEPEVPFTEALGEKRLLSYHISATVTVVSPPSSTMMQPPGPPPLPDADPTSGSRRRRARSPSPGAHCGSGEGDGARRSVHVRLGPMPPSASHVEAGAGAGAAPIGSVTASKAAAIPVEDASAHAGGSYGSVKR